MTMNLSATNISTPSNVFVNIANQLEPLGMWDTEGEQQFYKGALLLMETRGSGRMAGSPLAAFVLDDPVFGKLDASSVFLA
jgi:hypothetical protein